MEDKAYQWKVYDIPPKKDLLLCPDCLERVTAYHKGTDVAGLRVEEAIKFAKEFELRCAVIMVDYYETEKPIIVLESAMDEPEIAEFITSIVAIINEDGSIA